MIKIGKTKTQTKKQKAQILVQVPLTCENFIQLCSLVWGSPNDSLKASTGSKGETICGLFLFLFFPRQTGDIHSGFILVTLQVGAYVVYEYMNVYV